MNTIEAFLQLAPILGKLTRQEDDSIIWATDTEKYIYFQRGKNMQNASDSFGKPIPQGSGAYKALQTGQLVVTELPKELFGKPIVAAAYPVVENGKSIGVLGMSISRDLQSEVNDIAQEFSAVSQQLKASVEQVAFAATTMSVNAKELLENVRQSNLLISQISDYNKNIKSISAHTGIIALNANIEGARANNKVFQVVATEVNKLAMQSKELSDQISTLALQINGYNVNVLKGADETSQSTEQQAMSTAEISKALDHIVNFAERLTSVSRKL